MTERAMVAVCDILGFSNTVKNTTQKRLKTYHIENIKNLIKTAFSNYKNPTSKPQSNMEVLENNLLGYAFFSDTVLIYSVHDSRDGWRNVLNSAFYLLTYPILTPYKFRIGIAYGEFYYNQKENIFIGKALVEAAELERKQEWSGAALTNNAAKKFKGIYPEEETLIEYNVPVKQKNYKRFENLTVINWTTGSHPKYSKKYNWMIREENSSIVKKHRNSKAEKKIRNTEKFHYETCVQCNVTKK
ncbi:MAG: hypothetical protein ACUZ8N_00795 [Candidatus Scalindua sp.]